MSLAHCDVCGQDVNGNMRGEPYKHFYNGVLCAGVYRSSKAASRAKPEAVIPQGDELRSQLQLERELSDQLAAALKQHCRTHNAFTSEMKIFECECDSCAKARAALSAHAAMRSEAATLVRNSETGSA